MKTIVYTTGMYMMNVEHAPALQRLLADPVIAVGAQVVSTATTTPAANQQQQQQAAAGVWTFAVTPQQAEQLIFAALDTTMYFTLLPDKSPTARTNGRTFGNLFS